MLWVAQERRAVTRRRTLPTHWPLRLRQALGRLPVWPRGCPSGATSRGLGRFSCLPGCCSSSRRPREGRWRAHAARHPGSPDQG
eukprot:1318661-Pyramimonas_sp.AAC.1